MDNRAKLKDTQQGVVLVVGLIFMVMLTLLGVTAIQGTVLEERMAGNLSDRNSAFQFAETALREAETYLRGNDIAFNPLKLSNGPFQGGECANGLCPLTIPPQSSDFNGEGGKVVMLVDVDGDDINVSSQPVYIIELIKVEPTTTGTNVIPCGGQEVDVNAYFRVTSRAQGVNENTVVQLQTIFKSKLLAEPAAC